MLIPVSLILTTIIILLCLEIYLRLSLHNPYKLYDCLYFIPAKLELYYKSLFLNKYKNQAFKHIENYDSFLGWDYHIPTGRMRIKKEPDSQAITVVALGDSFTYGVDVKSLDSYPEQLQETLQKKCKNNIRVLNMGVAGYGIDQAVLKYKKYGRKYKPRLVVLGVYTRDYIRSRLSFYGYAKPFYKLIDIDPKQIMLTNTHILPPAELYNIIKSDLSISLYSWLFIESKVLYRYHTLKNPEDPNNFYAETDIVNEHILRILQQELLKTKSKLFIVQIPDGRYFKDKDALQEGNKEKFGDHLRYTYDKLGIQYIDLIGELPQRFSLREIYNDFYIHNPNNSIGHFTPKGNYEIAKIIADNLISLNLL